MTLPKLLPIVVALVCAGPLSAQLDDQWVEFTEDAALLSSPTISSSDLETDLAWGDLDNDGDTDLVVARIQPIMQGGARTNLLLMNEGGVLTDRTNLYASASDVVGDNGFETATADRDVVIVDVDNDGWLDVVTAVGFGLVPDPTSLRHPRVYINLGEDVGGNWLGLRYEEARIPLLINTVSGLPVAARFNAVAAGDVTGDGFADLYFGDHDAAPSSPFGGEPATLDTDDRLLINDGTGFFTDSTSTAMTPAMVASNFCNSAAIADFNLDGANDVGKQTNGVPGGAAFGVSYNDDVTPGTFASLQNVYTGSPYFMSTGDLNNDGRVDVVISENGNDGVLYNMSTGGGGTVNWSAIQTFDFLVGSDDSFAANSLVSDLDGDGLNDVLISDVDPQITGFNRRLHIYHNRGIDGSNIALLREERESASNADWIGVVGLTDAIMRGTHDIAVFDIDGDDLDDIVVSRNAGTAAYRRIPTCQTDLGFGDPGIDLTVCGNKLGSGNSTEAKLTGALPFVPVLVAVSLTATPVFIPEIQNTVVAFPPIVLEVLTADANGELSINLTGGSGTYSIVLQMLPANGLPTLFDVSNAVEIQFLGGN